MSMQSILPKVIPFVLGVVWFVTDSSFAQINVALPVDTYNDEVISIPVTVGDVTGHDIKAFLFTLSFDPQIFEISDVETEGDLAQEFALVINTETPGQATIGGAHFESLNGAGVLIHLKGKFLKNGTTDLTFNSFTFNEGNPLAATSNGQISSGASVSTEREGFLPDAFDLRGNYPNPFNPSTTLQFDLPEPAEVHVQIVDLLGREVMVVPPRIYNAGRNLQLPLDGSSLSSGIYVYRVSARGARQTYTSSGTMTLIK